MREIFFFCVLIVALGGSAAFGASWILGDLDFDGDVDFADFIIFAHNFGKSGGAVGRPSFTPETGSEWRGLTIAEEFRCAEYDRGDYRYSQSLEDSLIAQYGGIWSPYTGRNIDSITESQIEHIVALSEAHDSGLCEGDEETRARFASDMLNLALATATVNRQKSSKDASDWIPERNACWFAQRVVDVRLKYELTIDQAEAAALDSVLFYCESTEMDRTVIDE